MTRKPSRIMNKENHKKNSTIIKNQMDGLKEEG